MRRLVVEAAAGLATRCGAHPAAGWPAALCAAGPAAAAPWLRCGMVPCVGSWQAPCPEARIHPCLLLFVQCGEEGHIARDCPNPEAAGAGPGGRCGTARLPCRRCWLCCFASRTAGTLSWLPACRRCLCPAARLQAAAAGRRRGCRQHGVGQAGGAGGPTGGGTWLWCGLACGSCLVPCGSRSPPPVGLRRLPAPSSPALCAPPCRSRAARQEEEAPPDKEVEPEFGLSGALAAETNRVK